MKLNYLLNTFSESLILVVGGSDGYGDGVNSHRDAQIVDLSKQTRACTNLPEYPGAMGMATGAIVSGHPIICGGRSEGSNYHSECYHHNKANNTWTFLTEMATKRAFSASVPVKGKLLVLGGWDDDNRLATSEYVSPAWRCIPASMTSRLHHHLHIESSSLDTIISILCTSSNHCHP